MPLASVRTSQLPATALDWYGRYLAAVGERDLEGVLSFIDDDCIVQVNDQLPHYGKAAITRAVELYYETFACVRHEVLNLFGFEQQFSVELLCHYECTQGGARVTIPAAIMYDRGANGLFTSMRLYVSAGGMFQAFTEPSP